MPLRHAQPLWFYLGTAEVLGKVLLLDRDELLPGETGLAQLVLQEPVVAARLDRFVIRSYSPMTTLGGGIVIEPYARRHKRHRIEVLIELERKLEAGPTDRVLQVLEARPWGMPVEELVVLAGLGPEELGQAVEELAREGKIVELANEGQKYLVSADHVSKWQEKVLEVLGGFHHRHPLRKGMPREELRTKYFSPLPAKAFHSLLDYWQNQGVLVDQMGAVARHDFVPRPTAQEKEKLRAISLAFRQGGWQPPAPEQVFTSLRLTPEEGQELLRYLVQEGELVKVADGLYFSREAVEEAKKKVAELVQEHGGVELAAVRDALGSSRKFVLPLMEYFDQIHFTRRVGDKRFLYGSPGGRVGT
jgi:selenocysteine-specific elongation factor